MRDYRRFLSAHLQFLNGLCTLSMQSVNGSIRQFLSSPLITTELQPPMEFQKYIDTRLEQRESDAPATFTRLVSFISAINHGNAIVSTYGTNFKYYFPQWAYKTDVGKYFFVDDAQSIVSHVSIFILSRTSFHGNHRSDHLRQWVFMCTECDLHNTGRILHYKFI